jgi:predicted Fe-S protein YdhL (DUF1289 family)
MAGISSPCTGVCRLEDGYCVGCGRSVAQITQWSQLTEAERRQIMRHLPAPRHQDQGDNSDAGS